ncbi:MAG: AmmeMemoRadiSam system protein A [Bacteroidales bacterium]|nr:AmmeMemoRadiSam system protein A [Bacteroidales bacterium]
MLYSTDSAYTAIALEAIMEYLGLKWSVPQNLTEEIDSIRKMKCGCFVSIHRKDGSLRGCIGTIEPHRDHLYDGIRKNAVSAAFHDARFDPLVPSELNEITISVDLLSEPERIDGPDQLDPERYGVIVSDKFGRRAVLLPGISSVRTVDQQIEIVKKKAGLENEPDEGLIYYRFSTTRHH